MADEAMKPCLELRCKQMFYKDPDAKPTKHDAVVKKLFGSVDTTAYWCQCTQTGRGPDDQPANKTDCSKAGRKCYLGLDQLK